MATTRWPTIINLLSDLVIFHEYDVNEFLTRLIKIVDEIVPSDSCLIYRHDRKKKQLTLIASKNHHTEELGQIKLLDGEGITGWVAQYRKPVALEKEAYKDARFKVFKELPEDKYESFLSVPILDADGVAGVMNVQNKTPYTFSEEQITVLESIGKIVASAFIKLSLEEKVTDLTEKLEERKILEKAKGLLMKSRKISEDEAFKVIRREAMNKRKSMKEIAEAVIIVYK